MSEAELYKRKPRKKQLLTHVLQDMERITAVQEYAESGGKITKCPTRVAGGTTKFYLDPDKRAEHLAEICKPRPAYRGPERE